MTVRRTLVAGLASTALLLATSGPAAADPRVQFGPFTDTFRDVDPCTGRTHTVTIVQTFFVHEHGDRFIGKGVSTISTSSGYVGRGHSSFVVNGNVEAGRFTDILTRPSGARIRAQGVAVIDVRSGTVRVERFTLTCVGS
jgi:hypothetical protein